MREPRRIAGARAPLLERWASPGRAHGAEPAPLRVLDRGALLVSIAQAIGQLFNTRRPRDHGPDAGAPWVLNYGVPDFGGLSPASARDRDHYAAQLTTALAAFEPRLAQARIVLQPVPGEPLRLAGQLSGEVHLGGIREPVTFPLLLQTVSGELHLGSTEPEPSA
ncbi:MAG: type VI secretion system baseplate subunit TssE [Terriglobales bacterium]